MARCNDEEPFPPRNGLGSTNGRTAEQQRANWLDTLAILMIYICGYCPPILLKCAIVALPYLLCGRPDSGELASGELGRDLVDLCLLHFPSPLLARQAIMERRVRRRAYVYNQT